MILHQAYKFDILKKTQGQKTHNSRKKLNNSAEKLKDLTKFTERRKKLKKNSAAKKPFTRNP